MGPEKARRKSPRVVARGGSLTRAGDHDAPPAGRGGDASLPFEGKVFEDLARAAGVDAHWLQTGEGEPLAGAAAEEVSAFEGAVGWFLATETHEGRGDDAKRFLAERDQVNRASLQKYF